MCCISVKHVHGVSIDKYHHSFCKLEELQRKYFFKKRRRRTTATKKTKLIIQTAGCFRTKGYSQIFKSGKKHLTSFAPGKYESKVPRRDSSLAPKAIIVPYPVTQAIATMAVFRALDKHHTLSFLPIKSHNRTSSN